jgi:hypothetical protein
MTKITSVSYGRTISLGSGTYESVRLDLTATVPPDEHWKDVLEELRGEVLKQEKLIKKQGY